jgi:hypothetical protein
VSEPLSSYFLCPASPAPDLRERFLRDLSQVDAVFDAAARKCPLLLSATTGPTVGGDGGWSRHNSATDTNISLSGGTVFLFRPGIMTRARVLGPKERVLAGDMDFDCTLRRDPLMRWEDADMLINLLSGRGSTTSAPSTAR